MTPALIAASAGAGVLTVAGGVGAAFAFTTSPERAMTSDATNHGTLLGESGYPAPEWRDPEGSDMRRVVELIQRRPDFGRSTFKAPRGDMSGWVEVPLLPRARTRWSEHVSVSGAVFVARNSDMLRRTVVAIKNACVQAGYPDVDPRPLYELFKEESGWQGGAMWWRNAGNIKLNWGCRATPESLARGRLYVPRSVQGCIGAWVVVDRVNSSDAYYAWDSFANAMKFHLGVMFGQWHGDIYRSRGLQYPLTYLRQGTRDAAVNFARCLGGWYSGQSAEVRGSRAARFWDLGARTFPWWNEVR